MARILTFSRHQRSKEGFSDKIRHLWQLYSERDTFTKATIIIGILFLIVVPTVIVQKTGFFIHAGSSVYSTCINPPAGFNEQELQMLAQQQHVNWCKTLAQNVPGTSTSQTTIDQTTTPTVGTDPISVFAFKFQELLLSIRRLITGQ